jgi:hypothetical protein
MLDEQEIQRLSKTYPSMGCYEAGGSLLNGYTTVRNIMLEMGEMRDHRQIEDAWKVIRHGGEVIIQGGQIRAIKLSA